MFSKTNKGFVCTTVKLMYAKNKVEFMSESLIYMKYYLFLVEFIVIRRTGGKVI